MYLPQKGSNVFTKWANFVSAFALIVILITGMVFLNAIKDRRELGSKNAPVNRPALVINGLSPSELAKPDGSRITNENPDLRKPPRNVFGSLHSDKQNTLPPIPELPPVQLKKSASGEFNVDFVFRISDLDSAPIPIIQGRPRYPQNLVREGIEGRVLAVLSVDEDGNVYDVVVEKSDFDEFSESAKSAIMTWKFLPGRKNGKQVKFRMRVPISFQLIYNNYSSRNFATTSNQEFVRQPY